MLNVEFLRESFDLIDADANKLSDLVSPELEDAKFAKVAESVKAGISSFKEVFALLSEQRELVERWLNANLRGVIQMTEIPDAPTGSLSYEYLHNGEIDGGLRVGFGLTRVYEVDTFHSYGHRTWARMEMGWHKPDRPLEKGVYFRQAPKYSHLHASAVRKTDENGVQSGLWSSRWGGPDMELNTGARAVPVSYTNLFLGTMTPNGEDEVRANGVELIGKNLRVVQGVAQKAPKGLEHLQEFQFRV